MNNTLVLAQGKDIVSPCGITEILLSFANLVIHGLGSYLLVCILKDGRGTIQQFFITNLSVSLIFKHIVMINFPIFRMIHIKYRLNSDIMLSYIQMNYFTGIGLIYYSSIFYITFDRLMGILTGVKYPAYWNKSKTKKLIGVTWFLGLIGCFITTVACTFLGFHFTVYMIYIYIAIDLVFMLLASSTYCFMFTVHIKSQRTISISSNPNTKPEGLWTLFRKSRFFTSVILITNFILFQILPDFIYIFTTSRYNSMSDTLLIASQVADILDGIVYIYLHTCIRRVLIQKCCQHLSNEDSSVKETEIASRHPTRKLVPSVVVSSTSTEGEGRPTRYVINRAFSIH